ncbi:hypothetical protein E3N88_43490 [Mikania micrantha]|uniref:DUF4219 domain-containing protein n=1 Tax=Mikania micrantha TaxID=192012 RepID=A0A5N6LES8_9ASTR|nr:hypothetical protein E3N88_43490 [Mikania micrantha]
MADPNSTMVSVREQGNVTLQCPKLTESNYTTWSILMEQILKAYGLWDVVNTTGGVEVGEKKTATTKAMIFQTLPEDILMQVAQYPSAKEVWDSIKVRYLGADLVQKARLHTLRRGCGRIKAFEARLKSFDTPEDNDQSKLLLASSSGKRVEESESWQHGKGRGGFKECADA